MTLLTMVQEVLGETGWPVPSSVAQNTEGTAVQVLAIANAELRALSRQFNWAHLRTEYTFNTVIGQAAYAWPNDFRTLAWETVFDTQEYYRIKGSTPLQQWQRWQYGLEGQLSHLRFLMRYVDGTPQIVLSPTPVSVKSLTAFYFSKNFALDDGGTPKEIFTADNDTSRVPEQLVQLGLRWRFRRAKGLDFSAELAEYNSTVATQFAKFHAVGDIPVGAKRYDDELTDGYVPDNGFG